MTRFLFFFENDLKHSKIYQNTYKTIDKIKKALEIAYTGIHVNWHTPPPRRLKEATKKVESWHTRLVHL